MFDCSCMKYVQVLATSTKKRDLLSVERKTDKITQDTEYMVHYGLLITLHESSDAGLTGDVLGRVPAAADDRSSSLRQEEVGMHAYIGMI